MPAIGLRGFNTPRRATCRKRRISMHPLVEPVVSADLNWLVNRGRKLPLGEEDFHEFLKAYLAECAEPWSPGFERAA